jgi:methylenetetrahydrofolate dehydrogenase (NADP+)/methenyltetrahydrofolate cyclohydrolase
VQSRGNWAGRLLWFARLIGTPPVISGNVSAHKDIDGKAISEEILGQVRESVHALAAAGWSPKLVSITLGDTAPVEIYVRNQRRRAEASGLAFEERHFPAQATRGEILAAIATMNIDPRVTGIII